LLGLLICVGWVLFFKPALIGSEKIQAGVGEKTRLRAAFLDSETNQFLWVDGPSAKPKAGDSGTRKRGKGLKQGSFLTAVAKQTTVRAKHCQQVFCTV
jgi:hypothetical protein